MNFSKFATILYPKCPRCGGASKSAEETDYDHNGRHVGVALARQSMAGHPHPYLKAAHIVMSAGNQIYKRLPGKFGGLKCCKACGHEFR